jgi:sugar lactone lactonase YvrE
MLPRFRLAVALLPVLCLFSLLNAGAQAPIALPTTMTTIDSSSGIAARGGMAVDAFGNVFISDDVGGKVYLVNQGAGTTSVFSGGSASNCAGTLSSSGDGCAFANTKTTSGMRNISVDPYGNVILAGYSDSMVHILCRAASPLCTTGTPSPSNSSPIQVQVGYMGLVAGCTTGSGATKATGVDNAQGFMIGSSTSTTYSTSNFKTAACTTTGTVYNAGSAMADIYGNVYYSEYGAAVTSERWRVVVGPASYNGVTNPLYAVLALNTAWPTITAGYVYTVADYNSGTITKNVACTTAISGASTAGTAIDTIGDGCLFTSSVNPVATGYASNVAVDAAGNMIFEDPGRGLRVLFVSGVTSFTPGTPAYKADLAMKNAIYVNNKTYTGFTAAVPGYIYMLAGGGATTITATPTLGNSTAALSTSGRRLAISPQGNVYIGVYNSVSTSNIVYFYDINTGYIRILLYGGTNPATSGAYCTGTSGAKSIDTIGDGCPVSSSAATSYATFGNSASGLPLAVDAQGNLYIYDNLTSAATVTMVRKVLAQGMAPQTLGTPQTQTIKLHFPETETIGGSTTPTFALSPNSDYAAASSVITPTCTQRLDLSVDCTVGVTTTPSAAGLRSAALTVTLPPVSSGSWDNGSATIPLGAKVSGSVLAIDGAALGGTSLPLTTYPKLSGSTPASVALDDAGNLYEASGTSIQELAGGSTNTLVPALPATPNQIAVDPTGNIFAVNSGTSAIMELALTAAGVPSTYSAASVSYTSSGTAAPQAIATDQFGNLYVADHQLGGSSVYKLSMSPLTQLYQNQVTVASSLQNPVSLAVDPSGNVFVADKTAGSVVEYSPASGGVYTLTKTLVMTSPDAVAVDPAGDVYVQAGTTVTEFPVSGPTTAGVIVLTGLSNPVGVAVDGVGDVYSADAANTSITQVVRDAATVNFGASESTAYTATLTNVGNLVTTASTSTPTFSDVTLEAGSGTGCSISNNLLGAMSAGKACTISAEMSGVCSTTGPCLISTKLGSPSLFEFTPTASTVGSISFDGMLPEGTVYSTITSITPNTTNPAYSASGPEANFTVTVAPQSYPGPDYVSGTVSVTVDSTTTTPTLTQNGTSGQFTVYVTGLTACPTSANCHTISAQYYAQGSFSGSGPVSTGFNIAQATTSATWSPGATTQQVSAAVGTTGVLNPTATTNDSSVSSIAGNFAYTATCTSGVNCPVSYPNGTAVGIDASTYLPIGTYTLTATFIPTDTTDYSSPTAASTVIGYTVTQASTAASVGASTSVVAFDGSGNYTNLSAALAALPVTGGTIYIKPGTYTGQNAITYPNVFLRGLGGDPTQIVLTGENGNFSSTDGLNTTTYPNGVPTGFTAGPAGKAGDEGSATLDVSKNGFMGTTAISGTYSPANFYAEYLTIQNTFDTDEYTTTTFTAGGNGGTCATGTIPYTLQYLYNNNMSCGSQAQALYMSADQAILNNVNLSSQQDTLYAGYQGTSGSTYVPARNYIWKGLITGDIDYIYGDAALVLDHTNIFTTWHGATASGGGAGGTETITAQNKRAQTGSSNDYLSGYVCNACTLMSQSSTASGGAMSKLYYGRPYGVYSTFVLLNSQVDQVAPGGWIGWDGASQYLSTSTYAEFNTQALADTSTSISYPTSALGGVLLSGTVGNVLTTGTPAECASTTPYPLVYICGGNVGYGVTSSSTPVAAREPYALQLTAGTAAPYYPVNFLSNIVSTTGGYTGMPTTWNPVTALAARVNAFASTGTSTTVAQGSSVTILGRPQTPGAGIIPTGAYTFYDGGVMLVTGNLDASGEAYLTTSSLTAGTHSITLTYGGDGNFTGSTSNIPYIVNVTGGSQQTTPPTVKVMPAANATYGSATTVTVTVVPASGSNIPSGTLLFSVDNTTPQSVTLSGGAYTFTLSSLAVGNHSFSAVYEGDGNFLGAGATGYTSVSKAVLQVAAGNASMIVGGALPSLTYSITGFVGSDTQASAVTGVPALTTLATGAAIGEYPIAVTTGTLAANNYTFAFTGAYLYVTGSSQAAPVATGDSRTVMEPTFPAVCQQLTAAISEVNDDIPAAIDATITNPDGARIQAALNACSASYPGSGAGLAVQLSMDGAGHNAFLSGPLSMPSNVTLLVDPGVVLFFSRNAQDYDKVPGTHTCGNISTASATSSCVALIDIPKTSSNVGIMGYGKLDGRGGDPLINAIPPYQGYSWWGLSAAYASPNSQQNPRWIQMESGSSNITLYKITLRNAPLFHVTTGGAVSNFTAWDIKIITPTTSRNTDGIDPGNVTNVTITRSWISDGDDNVAVGGSGTTAPASNISVTNNHFFAGHGQSIGSLTSAGISNVLWDGNMAAGNGFAGFGSAISSTGTFAGGVKDGNSTGLRIKSSNSSGGLVTGIQYSNECLTDHSVDIQITPYYSSGDSVNEFPNFKNILMQNVIFMNDNSSTGTVELTGEYNTNNGTPVINPLYVTLDNVTFAPAFTTLVNSQTSVESASVWGNGNYSGGQGQYASLTYGPGDVSNYVSGGTSTNFVAAYANLVSVPANNDTLTNNITASTLSAPVCNFTYIAPELTGPAGLSQTITQGQNAQAVVILTPAVGGAAYPTGTVTLTDALTSNTTTVPLPVPGTTDTFFIPLTGLSVGTHTFTATYSGDTNYPPPSGQTVYSTTAPYVINVIAGSLGSSSTALALSSGTVSYGTSVTATATVTGGNPTGSVQFVVSGGGLTGSYTYATIALTSSSSTVSTAATSISLPYSTTSYAITAVYSGDPDNAGSTSSSSSLTVGSAVTTTVLTANTPSAALGNPFILTANVTSAVGTPTSANVTFAYSTTLLGAQTTLGTATLNNGTTTFFVNTLPVGSYYLFANYPTTGSFGASTSAGVPVTITAAANIVQLPSSPITLPYTITTIAGGSGLAIPSSGNMACAGATDKYGDGCQGTAMAFTSSDDMRAVTADPFGNVYLTDISATRIRRIAPNGIITTFAGGGSTCTPPASTSASGTGCTPTLTSLSKPRGVSADAAGNVFIADYSGDKVYEVKVADGLMYLVAGTGTATSTGDGGLAASATVDAPRSAWDDSIGNIYIADTSANKVRVIDTMGNIHTFAGAGGTTSTGDGGPAIAANFDNPQGVFVDPNLNVYVTDSLGKVRVICVTCGTGSPLDMLLGKLNIASPINGDIYTIAGNGSGAAYAGTYPILSTSISMAPQKLSMDNSGNLYISDSNGFVWFLDFHTGYIRAIAANGTVCASGSSAYGYKADGDGCPATQASLGSNSGNGFGAGTDTQGNLYISDSTNGLIRKVITGLASPSTAVGATTTQSVLLHLAANATLTNIAHTTSEWTSGTPSCSANADATTDCLVSSNFTPGVPGARSTPLMVTDTLSNTVSLALTGTGLGAGATLDPASKTTFGVSLSVAGLATDTAGNVYVSDATSKKLLRFAPAALTQGASATSTVLATLTAPGAVAIDPRGFVYVADTATGLIKQIPPTGAASTLPFAFTTPSGLATDALNNLYVSDSSAKVVYQINPITGVLRTLALGTLVSPKGLAVDPSGNLLIADSGAPAIYRFNLQTGVRTTVATSATAPTAVLVDAAGNLLIADAASIIAVPAGSHSPAFTVASLAPTALAIDSTGNLYTGSGAAVLKLTRTQGYFQFAVGSPAQTVSLLDSGNQSLSITSIGQTDTTDYTLAATASTDCTLSATLPSTLVVGGACSLTATFTPTTFPTATDTATFTGNFTNAGSVQLILAGPTAPPPTTTVVSNFVPAMPVYGQTVTINATVSGVSISPLGSVVFTLDGTPLAGVSVVAGTATTGVATTTVSGLSVGVHTVYAVYTSSNGFGPSTSANATVTFAKNTPAVALTSSSNPASSQNAITFTATVGFGGTGLNTAGLAGPTGTVTFTDSVGPTVLCSAVPLGTYSTTTGLSTATCTVNGAGAGLTAGTHNITASYSGDGNFVGPTAALPNPLVQVVADFTITATSATTRTVIPGLPATYTFSVSPNGTTSFPAVITFSASGLPLGASYTFTPTSLAAGSNTTPVTLNIQTSLAASAAQPGTGGGTLASRLAPFTLALLLLPFAAKLRKAGRRFSRMISILLLLAASAAAVAGLSGCGKGMFGQPQQSYTVVVTATMGTLERTTNVTLTVE